MVRRQPRHGFWIGKHSMSTRRAGGMLDQPGLQAFRMEKVFARVAFGGQGRLGTTDSIVSFEIFQTNYARLFDTCSHSKQLFLEFSKGQRRYVFLNLSFPALQTLLCGFEVVVVATLQTMVPPPDPIPCRKEPIEFQSVVAQLQAKDTQAESRPQP